MAAYDEDAFEVGGGGQDSSRSEREDTKIVGAILHRSGANLHAGRLSEGAPALKRNTSPLDAKELAAYAGDYALSRSMRAHISSRPPLACACNSRAQRRHSCRTARADRFCDERRHARGRRSRASGAARRARSTGARACSKRARRATTGSRRCVRPMNGRSLVAIAACPDRRRPQPRMTQLSVNVNKIAVLRNSRGGSEPDPADRRARGACRGRERHHRASAAGSAPYPRRRHRAHRGRPRPRHRIQHRRQSVRAAARQLSGA